MIEEIIRKLKIVGVDRFKGYPRALIRKEIARLGINPSDEVIEFYYKLGRSEICTDWFNHILKPEDWYIEGDYWVFGKENQEVSIWAVKVGEVANENSTVYIATNDAELVWHQEELELKEFLLFFLLYNYIVSGGGNYYESEIDYDQLKLLLAKADLVLFDNGMWVVLKKRIAAGIMQNDSGLNLIVNSPEKFSVENLITENMGG